MTGQKRVEDLTGAELETIIGNAVKAGDMQMVEAALKRMVMVDPGRAVRVYDELKAALRVADILQPAAESPVHACPPGDEGWMPCCHRTPFEIPRWHRMTNDPDLVTCQGRLT